MVSYWEEFLPPSATLGDRGDSVHPVELNESGSDLYPHVLHFYPFFFPLLFSPHCMVLPALLEAEDIMRNSQREEGGEGRGERSPKLSPSQTYEQQTSEQQPKYSPGEMRHRLLLELRRQGSCPIFLSSLIPCSRLSFVSFRLSPFSCLSHPIFSLLYRHHLCRGYVQLRDGADGAGEDLHSPVSQRDGRRHR